MIKPYEASPKSSKPPECSTWRLWVGKEVEGNSKQLGVKTLFVRDASEAFIREQALDFRVRRIWFCKEFLVPLAPHCRTIASFLDDYDVAIEVLSSQVERLPKHLRERAQLFLKIPHIPKMKKGDFICAGPPFEDELFEVGKGLKMTPKSYMEDIRIT